MRKVNVNYQLLSDYLYDHKDMSISEVFHYIKNKKAKDRTDEEVIVFSYMLLHKKKLGIK